MSHSEVMKWFESYFPDYSGERIDVFFPNGRNSIRIRQKMVRNLYSLITVKKNGNLKQLPVFEWNEGRKKVKCARL